MSKEIDYDFIASDKWKNIWRDISITDEQYIRFNELGLVEKKVLMCKAFYILKAYCKCNPTCEKCPYRKEHKGCYFRDKTPREWGVK